jgi:hypothetical protein
MIPPPEDLSPLPQESPSIFGRIGQRVANAPSDILNDLMRLSFNVGFKDPDQTQAPQVPIPYDVPEAKTIGESAVDIGANLAESLPLFMTGEGAGAGIARLTGAGPVAARMLRMAGAFGTQGLSESPEHAAVEGTLGAGFGAAEALPGPLRYLAALGVGAGTYANLKGEGASDRQSAIMGAVQGLLPLVTHRPIKQAIAREIPPAEIGIGESPEPLGPKLGYRESIGLRDDQFKLQAPNQPPEGSLIREPIYSEGEAKRVATLQQRPPAPLLRLANEDELPFVNGNGAAELPTSTRVQATTEQPLLPLGAPNGSLVRDPIMTMLEMRRGSGVQPPEGSLIREPAITMGEARTAIAARTPTEGRVIPFEEPTTTSTAPTPPEPKPSGRLLLSSVLSHENTSLAQKAAEKLGLEFKGVQDNQGAYPNQLYFNLTTPGRETTISLESGSTYKDLKNKVLAKNREYDQAETAAAVKKSEALKKVATLQQESIGASAETAAAKSPPSSLENALVPESQLPHGLKYGDKALIYEDGEKIVATLQPGVEPVKPIRAIGPKGEVFDRLPSEIKPLGFAVKQAKGDIESVGGLQDLEKLGTEQQKGSMKLGGGKMKLSNFGEHGSISPEALSIISRYVVAPAIGGAVGYAEDDQHRVGSAVAGAVIGGLAGHMGGKILRLLAERHPDIKPGSGRTIAAMRQAAGEDIQEVAKAVTGNYDMARRAASSWGWASEYDKLAHWVNKNARTDINATRMRDKAYGLVEDLSRAMGDSIKSLYNVEGIDSYHVPISQYFEGKIDHATFLKKVTPEIADLAATALVARTKLQGIILDGLGAGKLSTTIQNSIGKYLTTAYRLFHDSKYKPTFSQIETAARSLEKQFPGETLETRIAHINEYLHEVAVNKGMFSGGFAGIKGESLGGILSRYQTLTPEFKEMLGQYKNPLERMAFTAMKLVNGGRSAEFFNEVARGVKDNGLKYAYATEELQSTIATLQHDAKFNFTPELRAAAQAKLDELQQYIPNPSGASNGRLAGKWMDVKMREQLANYDSATRLFKSPITRSFANATNLIKYGKIILSPLQFTRQIIQLPILGMIARTNPIEWAKAYRIINDESVAGKAEYSRLRRLGIIGGDQVGGMLRRDMEAMLDGRLDAILGDRIKEGLHKWEEIWRTPDLITRVSAFKKKEAELLAQGMSADEAANKAIDHTNRYTMNYGAVPPIVMKGRQLPFINQYLSWTYETLRITKNLLEDAKKGDAYSIGVLSTIATAPFIIQQMSEAALSPQDKDEWNKVKNLGPSYNRYNFRIVQGRLPNGDFRYLDFTPLVIHDQFMRMMRATMAGDSEAVAAANPIAGWENTPLLNVASIFVTGRNRYTGDKLNGAADYADAVRKEVAPTLLGTELDRIVRALTPNDTGGLGTMNLRTGQTNSISDILQTYLSSIRPYTLRPEVVLQQATSEARDRVRAQQGILRRTLSSNASAEQKENARKDFQRVVAEIVRSYHSKIQVNPESVQP